MSESAGSLFGIKANHTYKSGYSWDLACLVLTARSVDTVVVVSTSEAVL
jgi:hypothetical protein